MTVARDEDEWDGCGMPFGRDEEEWDGVGYEARTCCTPLRHVYDVKLNFGSLELIILLT